MENRFRQYQVGTIEESSLEQLGGGANQDWYQSEMFREWWARVEPEERYAPDFVAFMEQQVIGLGS